jgi:hypothetical protein
MGKQAAGNIGKYFMSASQLTGAARPASTNSGRANLRTAQRARFWFAARRVASPRPSSCDAAARAAGRHAPAPARARDLVKGPHADGGAHQNSGAASGFGVETVLHLLRLIVMGVFDRYPKLKLVVGHGRRGLPYWAYRLDYMHGAGLRSGRYAVWKPLELPICGYFKRDRLVAAAPQHARLSRLDAVRADADECPEPGGPSHGVRRLSLHSRRESHPLLRGAPVLRSARIRVG